jgi:YHS domain-containing protein
MPATSPSSRALILALAIAALPFISPAAPALAKEPPVYTASKEKLALSGYDPVAYFVAGKPVKGSGTISTTYNGATWHFASEANRTTFAADPAKYAPQFGGYCSWAVSQGYTASGDPLAWKIVNGKLYVNYNQDVAATWSKDISTNISKGNANWPKVLDK